jgi:hypothetical protein
MAAFSFFTGAISNSLPPKMVCVITTQPGVCPFSVFMRCDTFDDAG